MSYQYRRYERYNERPRRSPLRCMFVSLTLLVWVVLLGILLVRFVVRPMLSNMIEQRVAQSVEVARPQSEVVVPVPGSGLLPTLPPGSYAVSDADANAWLAANRDQLQGIDDVRLRFAPGEAQADVTALGVTSTARAEITAVDGRIVVSNARLDPPLDWLVDIAPLTSLLQDQLNNDLAATGRRVTSATVEAGQVTVTVE